MEIALVSEHEWPSYPYYWLQVCSTLTRRRVNAELDRSIGLTATQIGALFYIRGSDGCTLKDLASALHVNGSAITTLVSRLEQRELVMRERSAQDGRAFQLSLTPAGHTAVEHAEPQLGELNAWIQEGFTREELDIVLRFLKTTVGRLSAAPEETVDE